MSKQLHRKAVCMFVIEAVCMILLGMFLTCLLYTSDAADEL